MKKIIGISMLVTLFIAYFTGCIMSVGWVVAACIFAGITALFLWMGLAVWLIFADKLK
jgi:hypothetical protein